MLGRGGAEDVVQSQKFIDEITAVDRVHAAVPGKDDGKEGEKPLPREKAEDGLRLFHRKAPEDKEKAGKDKADGAFREAGKPSGSVGDHQVLFAVFCDADVGRKHGRDGEEEKDAVCDDGVGDHPALERGREHDAGPDGDDIVFQDAPEIPDEKCHGEGACKHCRQASGEVSKAKYAVGEREEPVDHDGLIIPVDAIDLRGYPVAGLHHFTGGQCVVRLDRIGDRKQPAAPEEEEKGDDEEADKRDQGAAFVLFGKLRLFSLTLLTFCTQGDLL